VCTYRARQEPSLAGVLRPDVESAVQERHGPVGACPEEGHKNDPRDGTALLWGQAERAGAVQPGEEKALRRPHSNLAVTEGDLQESWGGTFYKDT